MCGIFSIFSNKTIENLSTILDSSIATMSHRGPDAHGLLADESNCYGLAHTRLSIIDIDDASNQPVISGDKRFELVFNGEIYNYLELREECKGLGSIFKTNGDAEVIIEVYRHFGSEFENKLRGMWAFTLIDKTKNLAIISRDYLGIKPLYYAIKDGKILFGSEIKVFHSLSKDFLQEDEKTIYLYEKYDKLENGNWTFYDKIKRFPAGHSLELSLNDLPLSISELNFKKFFQNNKSEVEKINESELRLRLQESLDLHLRSDVPVGITLSGGIDSSAIALLANNVKNADEITTFTTKFDEHKEIDESKYAQAVSSKIKAKAIYTKPKYDDFIKEIEKVIHFQDEPFRSTSIYSQFCIFKNISETDVKVVLSGQGADELFFGYPGFFSNFLAHLLKSFKIGKFLKYRKLLIKNYNYRYPALKAIRVLFKILFSKTFETDHYYYHEAKDTLSSRLDYVFRKNKSFEDYLFRNLLDETLPSLLRYEDRNSMAFSIESRVPFVDSEIIKFALSCSTDNKIEDGITKAILRNSVKDLLPEVIYNRLDKLGFPAPEKQWLKEITGNNVKEINSSAWKSFILNKWREMNSERMNKCRELI